MTGTTQPSRDSAQFAEQVQGMFDRVAGRYDLLNSLMSAGLHHRWRERAVDVLAPVPDASILDVCCGTGDLTFELAGHISPEGHVVGCDFSEPMLDLAREKARRRGLDGVRFEWADALNLPYDAGRFEAVTVGFGLRNFADWDKGLREMARVLKPGGKLMILEFTRPTRPPFSTFYSLWFDRLAPVLGKLSDDPGAYAYLTESLKTFPGPRGLAERMDAAGLQSIRYRILAGGIVAIHSGVAR
ncbi:MAG TPA: bifunctional demethylmenaquinone methyltransferase/2-methoxy-6-polyprenyl-1,4-benzoquinol methylase UbiE [Solirubrobacterales bacterium]